MSTEESNLTGLRGKRDGDLLRLYTAGRSEEAFTELRRRYVRLVYAACLRETHDPALAEDAAQGVFLLLSRKARSLETRETLADWLYTAACFVSRNLRRQEQRRQMKEARVLTEMPPPAGGEERNPLWEQIEPHLNEALNHLKPGDRQAILLRFVQQHSLAEVGADLGLSENTARMRVQRALEKVRKHLGRAGVAVPLALLAVLLLEQSAPAAPPSLMARFSMPPAPSLDSRAASLAGAVHQASLRFVLLSTLRPLLVFLALIAVLGVAYRPLRPLLSSQRLSPPEQRQAFQTLNGVWRGSLEYADDQTGRHFTYPTTVTIRTLGGGTSLSLVAAYVGSSAVDRTTFTGSPRAGTFSVTNGGAQSSHRLTGIGELVRLPGGGFAFQGKNPARDSEVRIRFTPGPNSLTMQEEYRLVPQGDYQFRNRFILRRQ